MALSDGEKWKIVKEATAKLTLEAFCQAKECIYRDKRNGKCTRHIITLDDFFPEITKNDYFGLYIILH